MGMTGKLISETHRLQMLLEYIIQVYKNELFLILKYEYFHFD